MNGFALSTAQASPERLVVRARAEAGATWFEGHFPGEPILPAVAILHLAQSQAREHWSELGALVGVPALRLRRPVLPESEFELVLQRGAGASVGLLVRAAEGELARARLGFEEGGGDA